MIKIPKRTTSQNMDVWSWLCFECAVTGLIAAAFMKSGLVFNAVDTQNALSIGLVAFASGMVAKPLSKSFEPYFHRM
jgi:hypothetical protein